MRKIISTLCHTRLTAAIILQLALYDPVQTEVYKEGREGRKGREGREGGREGKVFHFLKMPVKFLF